MSRNYNHILIGSAAFALTTAVAMYYLQKTQSNKLDDDDEIAERLFDKHDIELLRGNSFAPADKNKIWLKFAMTEDEWKEAIKECYEFV